MIESESRPHSDRARRKKDDRVRKQVSFGQDKEKKGGSSQKAGLIRTGQGEKSRIESESRCHSDRTRRKKQDRVRKRVSFRQDKEKKAGSSLNIGLIRTGQGEKRMIESENRCHSDRARRKRQDRVRKQVSFGQEKEKKTGSSLNTGVIRTGQEGKRMIESESRSHSDRTRRKKG